MRIEKRRSEDGLDDRDPLGGKIDLEPVHSVFKTQAQPYLL
jgi:hypothetical protein